MINRIFIHILHLLFWISCVLQPSPVHSPPVSRHQWLRVVLSSIVYLPVCLILLNKTLLNQSCNIPRAYEFPMLLRVLSSSTPWFAGFSSFECGTPLFDWGDVSTRACAILWPPMEGKYTFVAVQVSFKLSLPRSPGNQVEGGLDTSFSPRCYSWWIGFWWFYIRYHTLKLPGVSTLIGSYIGQW